MVESEWPGKWKTLKLAAASFNVTARTAGKWVRGGRGSQRLILALDQAPTALSLGVLKASPCSVPMRVLAMRTVPQAN